MAEAAIKTIGATNPSAKRVADLYLKKRSKLLSYARSACWGDKRWAEDVLSEALAKTMVKRGVLKMTDKELYKEISNSINSSVRYVRGSDKEFLGLKPKDAACWGDGFSPYELRNTMWNVATSWGMDAYDAISFRRVVTSKSRGSANGHEAYYTHKGRLARMLFDFITTDMTVDDVCKKYRVRKSWFQNLLNEYDTKVYEEFSKNITA